jgi:hypothetical protein
VKKNLEKCQRIGRNPKTGMERRFLNVMYQRDKCIAQASACREKAQADPARSDYWIDRAIVWHRRAVQASHGKTVTYEVNDGRMIPK